MRHRITGWGCILFQMRPLACQTAPGKSTNQVFRSHSHLLRRWPLPGENLLGEGGKKRVYLAHDNVLDRDVVFALIKTEKLDPDGHKRVTREAQAMGKLGDHPNIVSIFDMGENEGQPYIVLPLMSGGDVEGLIEKAPDYQLPLDEITSIARSVCSGLDFAHSKGIIHRDLKPGNVCLSEDGEEHL